MDEHWSIAARRANLFYVPPRPIPRAAPEPPPPTPHGPSVDLMRRRKWADGWGFR